MYFKDENDFFNKSACPVECKYCMVTKIDKRSSLWKQKHSIGINKTLMFINRMPFQKEKINIPKEFWKGEYIGFEGISDPFWHIFHKDLEDIIQKIYKYNAKKLILVTKWNLTQNEIDIIKDYKKVVVAVSITGLDMLENTKTKDRLKNLELLLRNNVPTLPFIHPYIHTLSDLSFLKELKNLEINKVSYKGFRYSKKNMPWLKELIKDKKIYQKYKESNENEILIGEDFLKKKLKENNLKFINFRDWVHFENNYFEKNDFIKTKDEAIKIVNDIFNYANISSSADKNDVKNFAIKRRLRDFIKMSELS